MNELAGLFKALADESRLRILNLLFELGELCVCDIESTLGFTQTKVSRHMNYLTRAGLTQDRKQGRWVLYRIARPKSDEQRTVIESVRDIVQANTQARNDLEKIRRNINRGCCATFVRVKPQPASLHLS
jgi:ArsR family transcriptional regulator